MFSSLSTCFVSRKWTIPCYQKNATILLNSNTKFLYPYYCEAALDGRSSTDTYIFLKTSTLVKAPLTVTSQKIQTCAWNSVLPIEVGASRGLISTEAGAGVWEKKKTNRQLLWNTSSAELQNPPTMSPCGSHYLRIFYVTENSSVHLNPQHLYYTPKGHFARCINQWQNKNMALKHNHLNNL